VCPLIFQVCPLIFQVCPLILGVCPLILGVCPLIPFNAPTKAQIKATNQSAQIKGHTWESQFYEVKSTKIKGHTLRGSFKGQHKGPLRQPPFWIALMGPSSPPPFSLSDALAGALTTWAAEARCIIICIETQLYDVHVYLYSTIRGKHALNGMDPGPSWAGRGEVVLLLAKIPAPAPYLGPLPGAWTNTPGHERTFGLSQWGVGNFPNIPNSDSGEEGDEDPDGDPPSPGQPDGG
jgi:hypothetical protein